MDKSELGYFWQPFMGEAELVVIDDQGNVTAIEKPEYHMTKDGTGKIALMLPVNVQLIIGTTEPVLTKSKEATFVVWVDGACSGNPGPGGWAYLIQKIGGYAKRGGREEATTNQKMELRAALEALQKCVSLSISIYGKGYRPTVKIHSDSEYVVKTMNLEFNSKANLELINQLKQLCLCMTVEWVHVPRNSRSQMELCDRLAKKASKTPNFKYIEGDEL